MMYTKVCNICRRDQPLAAYHNDKRKKDGKDNRCKLCKSEQAAKAREDNYFFEYTRTKKGECTSKSIPYNLDAEFLESIWTGNCAITGHSIQYGKKGSGSHHKDHAHLDRFNPDLGYTKGNVAWVSGRINRIKYNATIQELSDILNYMIKEKK